MKYIRKPLSPGYLEFQRFKFVWLIIISLLTIIAFVACQPVSTPKPTDESQTTGDATIEITSTPNQVGEITRTPTEIAPTSTEPPTATNTPEPSEEPTQTPAIQATAQPLTTGLVLNLPELEEGVPSATATTVISVRTGPALNYPVYGLLLEGQAAELTGISENGEWWAISVPGVPLDLGWVFSAYVETDASLDVPTIQPPPTPPTLVFSPPDPDSEAPFVRFRETVYARSGPGVEFPAYGVIQQGQEAQAIHISEDGNWYQILVYSNQVPTRQAWVPAQFMEARRASLVAVGNAQPIPGKAELPTPPAGVPTGVPMTPLYLRDGPGLEYAVFGVAPQTAPLELLGISTNGEWLRIAVPATTWPDGMGWVPAGFVASVDREDLEAIEPPPLAQQIVAFEPGAGDSWARPLENVFFYAGPGIEFNSPGYLPANQKAVLSGVSRAGDWYIVRVPLTVLESGQGWVRADLVETLIQSSLAVIEPPP